MPDSRQCERATEALHLHANIDRAINNICLPHTPTMVSNSLSQRMRKLQTKLLSIRLGSGAFVLPKDIKKIHLRFAPRMEGGHMGSRYIKEALQDTMPCLMPL